MEPLHQSPNPSSTSKRPRADSNDNQESTTRRRIRVSEACDTCRTRKDRCDGGRPTCNNCLRARRDCTYRPTKKRGLRTGYVRALETLLGLLFTTVQGLDPWVAALFQGQETAPLFRFDHLESQSTDVSVEAFIDAWRKSALLKQIEQALSTEGHDDDDVTDSVKGFDRKALQASVVAANVLRSHGTVALQTSDGSLPTPIDFHPASHTVSIEEDAAQPRSSPGNSLLIEAFTEFEQSVPLPSDAGADAVGDDALSNIEQRTSTPLPPDWRSLLDLYFSTTHCWLPMCQKHELLRTAYVMASDASTQGLGETGVPVTHGERACLNAILYYASLQRSIGDTRSGNREDYVWTREATTCCSAIQSLLPDKIESYEIGHVRALLIMTLINIACGNQKQAWTSTGVTIYHIALLAKPQLRHERPTSDLGEGAKRTVLCCMALDSLVAAWNGLRPYFTRSDIVSIGPLLTDGLEEWEPWKSHQPPNGSVLDFHAPGRSLSTFNQVINLVSVLNDMLRSCNGFLTKNCTNLSQETISDWSQRIPPPSDDGDPSGSPQQFSCYLLTSSIRELMKLHSGQRAFSETAHNPRNLLQEIDNISQSFIIATGRSFVSPICGISLFLLRLSVDRSSQPKTKFETELQGLRDHLHKQNFLQRNTSLNVQDPRSGLSSRLEQRPLHAARYSESHLERIEHENLAGAGAGFDPDRLESQHPASYLHPESIYPTPVGTAIRESSDAFVMPHTAPSSIGVNLSDDSLFQSLADLDSADW
jgi:hypothetical protein